AHTHSAMSLLGGVSDDLSLHPWLVDVQRVERRMTLEDIRLGVDLALVDMIRSGTTTVADMYCWGGRLLGDGLESGVRVVAAPGSFDLSRRGAAGSGLANGREVMRRTEELREDFLGDDRIDVR